jgi:hypothetical protein
MSHDLNLNAKSLEKLLGNMPDEFKDLLSGITKKDMVEPQVDTPNSSNNFEMLMQIKNMFDKVDGCKDEKIELIQALKPFLRESRQTKVNQCIKVLRLTKFVKEALVLVNIGIGKEMKGE